MYDQDGNFLGTSKYGSAFKGVWPNATLGSAMNESVAGWGATTPYSGGFPTMGSLANAGNPGSFNFSQNPNTLITQAGDSSAGPGNMIGTAVGAAAKLNPALATATGVLGGIQTIGGLIGLATTKEPEKYSLTSRNKAAISDAENQAKFGLSPQQISTATQGAREQLNTDIFNARNIAGNSASRAVFGLNRGMNLRSMNNLAVADFNAMDAKRRYRDSTYQMEQNIQDRNTGLDWNLYNQKQQAYGGAMRTGTQNLAGYFNLAQALKF